MPNAKSVAKELVRLSLEGDDPDPLTNKRLQKLLYYAQAWSLVVRESELFPEDIQAWRWGPVVPDVYHSLPGQGANIIQGDAFADSPDLSADEAEFVSRVWEAYKPYSASELSRRTHEETPYKKAWGDRPVDGIGNEPISLDEMEAFFAAQTMPGQVHQYEHRLRLEEQAACREIAEFPMFDPSRLAAAASFRSASVR